MAAQERTPRNPARPDRLYREDVFTDRRAGSIRRLTPVTSDGATMPRGTCCYPGQTQLLTPAGVLPLGFEIEAFSLKEAWRNFPAGVKVALEQAIDEAREMRREAASRIVVPDARRRRPGRRQDQVSLKRTCAPRGSCWRRLPWLVAACLAACADTQVGVPAALSRLRARTAGRWPPPPTPRWGVPPAANLQIYPLTVRSEATDNYFGTKVADPYRWLENLDSPQVQEWVTKENALSQPRLAALPQRPWLKQRLAQLWSYERYDVPVQARRALLLPAQRRQAEPERPVRHRAARRRRAGCCSIPNTASADATVALAEFTPSEQGDAGRLRALRRRHGLADLALPPRERRRATCATSCVHQVLGRLLGARRLGRLLQPLPGAARMAEAMMPAGPAVYFHKLGTPQDATAGVRGHEPPDPRAPATVTEDGRYLVITLHEGYLRNAVEMHRPAQARQRSACRCSAPGMRATTSSARAATSCISTPPTTRRCGRVIAVNRRAAGHAAHGGARGHAPRSSRPATSAAASSPTTSRTRTAWRASSSADGKPAGTVPLPGLGGIEGFQGERHAERDVLFLHRLPDAAPHLSPRACRPTRATLWREAAGRRRRRTTSSPSRCSTTARTARACRCSSRTGATCRATARADAAYGYGGFNVSLTPTYRAAVQAWLEMGGAYAEANLRGGGEYGEAWHTAGTLTNKQHVFDDFIAAAEYPDQRALHEPARLGDPRAQQRRAAGRRGADAAARTCSARRCRPSACSTCCATTPPAPTRGSGPPTTGCREEPEQFKALYAYSPVQNVKKGVCYPPTLITTADHDDRVVPWHSYKFAAALQAAQACANPILIRVETRAGTWRRQAGVDAGR